MNETARRLLAATVALAGVVLPRLASAETLSVSDAVREALRNNPTLRAASSDLVAARGLTTRESARYDATLTFKLGATHSENPSLSPGASSVQVASSDVAEASSTLEKTLSSGTELSASVGSTASKSSSPYVVSSAQGAGEPLILQTGPGYLLSTKLGVTQPLLRGSGSEVTLSPYHQAVAEESATLRERDRTASAVARDVLLAYWELWYASKAIEVDRTARETARAQRDDAALRARTGSLAPADVLTFETQLATKDEALLQSELEQTTRRNDLGELLGRERGQGELEVFDSEPPSPQDLPVELVSRARESSPEVAASQANAAVVEVQGRTAADQYRTRLDLDAYLQAQGLGNRDVPSAFSQLAGLGVLSAHVGLTLELPLTGARQRGEASRALATLDAARQRLSAARNQAASQVTTLARKHELARRRIELATVSTEFASRQLAAKQALFATGSAAALEVTQAEDSVQAANKRLARARADAVEADVALAYHLGALLKSLTIP